MTYAEGVEWLFSLHRFGMKLGLDNIRSLLEALGRPDERYETILVAGTNGKGSTAAMLHAILLAAGFRAGLYTSPHLVRTEERIRIGARDIDPAELAALLNEVRALSEQLLAEKRIGAHPTFFEVITSAGLLAFARAGVEVAVLEVGLGGRLDATNAVSPILSIITSIDLDHQEQLGSTLAAIAREKAGILRPGVTALLGELGGEALGAIREEAAAVGSPLLLAREGCRIGDADGQVPSRARARARATPAPEEPHPAGAFSLATPVARYPRLSITLPGEHQRENALLAVRAAEILDRHWRLAPARACASDRIAADAAANVRGFAAIKSTDALAPASERVPPSAAPAATRGSAAMKGTDDLAPAPERTPPSAAPAAPGSEPIKSTDALAPASERIAADAIVRGLASARWAGRLEWVAGRPALLLDGAHNPAGARVLSAYLEALGLRPVLLFAAMRDKDVDEMLEALMPRVGAAVFTSPPSSRAWDPADLAQAALRARAATGAAGGGDRARAGADTSHGSAAARSAASDQPAHPAAAVISSSVREVAALPHSATEPLSTPEGGGACLASPDVSAALAIARSLAGPQGTVLVAGSLFLVGAVKEVLAGLPVRAGEVR